MFLGDSASIPIICCKKNFFEFFDFTGGTKTIFLENGIFGLNEFNPPKIKKFDLNIFVRLEKGYKIG